MLEGYVSLLAGIQFILERIMVPLGFGNLLIMIRLLSLDGYEDFPREATLFS